MADKVYRTFHGIVQFDPRDGQAAGQDVRNIALRAAGLKEQAIMVSATLWPSHDHIKVEKGDLVTVEGSYQQNKGTNKNGDQVVYHNLSVIAISVNGSKPDYGVKPETSNAVADEDDDTDDIPY